MSSAEWKDFARPDEVRSFQHGRIELLHIGGGTVGRMTLEPGWGWSTDVKPIAQVLPYPGKKSLDKQIGGAGVRLSEAELALRRTEIVRDVKAGFSRVLASERLVEVSTQLVAVADSSAMTARKRVDAGATAYQEQLRAEVQLEQARTELTGYQRELASARQMFASLLGQPDLREASLAGSLAEAPDASLMEGAEPEGLARHPSTIAARSNLDRAQLEQRRARLEPYPGHSANPPC